EEKSGFVIEYLQNGGACRTGDARAGGRARGAGGCSASTSDPKGSAALSEEFRAKRRVCGAQGGSACEGRCAAAPGGAASAVCRDPDWRAPLLHRDDGAVACEVRD